MKWQIYLHLLAGKATKIIFLPAFSLFPKIFGPVKIRTYEFSHVTFANYTEETRTPSVPITAPPTTLYYCRFERNNTITDSDTLIETANFEFKGRASILR